MKIWPISGKKDVLRAGVFVKYTYEGVDDPVAEVDRAADLIKKHNLKIYFGPEWGLSDKERLYCRQEKDNLFDMISEKTKDSGALIMPGSLTWHDGTYAYNTAPIFCEGEIKEYHKMDRGGDTIFVNARDYTKEMSFGKKLGFFDWNGYRCGFGICADSNRIKHYFDDYPDQELLDFHFIMACGTDVTDNYFATKLGGYGLYCDGWVSMDLEVYGRVSDWEINQIKGRGCEILEPNDKIKMEKEVKLQDMLDRDMYTKDIDRLNATLEIYELDMGR